MQGAVSLQLHGLLVCLAMRRPDLAREQSKPVPSLAVSIVVLPYGSATTRPAACCTVLAIRNAYAM
jgi:hypothetical protein